MRENVRIRQQEREKETAGAMCSRTDETDVRGGGIGAIARGVVTGRKLVKVGLRAR